MDKGQPEDVALALLGPWGRRTAWGGVGGDASGISSSLLAGGVHLRTLHPRLTVRMAAPPVLVGPLVVVGGSVAIATFAACRGAVGSVSCRSEVHKCKQNY